MLKILIADDHAVVRSGMRLFLENEPDLRLAGEACNGDEVLALVESEQWDLLLLDLSLPDADGLQILRRIRRDKPALPILIFSMFPEDDYAMAALEAGASGYLPKDSDPARVLDAIRHAGRGERYLSPELTEKLLAGKTGAGKKQRHDRLSAREFEIMKLVARGMTLIVIGQLLHLSPKTVSTYRARVLEKLNLRNNVELARYVIEHKLDR